MFGKLLKHDFLAIARKAIPLSIAALGGSIIGGISMNIINNTGMDENPVLDALLGLGSAASVVVIIAALIGIQILIYTHFYQNLFTDEGYLTFTLPLKRSSILLSKTLNAIIWTALSGALAVILATVTDLFADGIDGILSFFYMISLFFKNISPDNVVWAIIYTIEGLLIVTALSVMQINLIQFCIALGSTLAKKHKLLASFGVYYAVNSVLSFAGQTLIIIGIEPISKWFSSLSETDPLGELCAIAFILLSVVLILSAVAVIFYALSLRRIKYHLNIA